MSTLDEYKKQWGQSFCESTPYDQLTFQKVIKKRVNQHTRSSMQYFWASFAFQILIYALCGHMVIRYWFVMPILLLSLTGILLYIPFTVMLLKKFKRFAVVTIVSNETSSTYEYLLEKQRLLENFFRFKKQYEFFLIPLISAIGVFLVFAIYVPGGVQAFPFGAVITYLITLLSCYLAIRAENYKSFVRPLAQIKEILREYETGASIQE
ncbi:hypothetical protein QNI16_38440 [Cytophagaceae bacterium YF14B1]|uniref:Uncharacterized protein n=1 Tax=Xanthocytophaga flava TaxID=3048013 RepID=A0AAE3QVW7_9BACT|nr:hypothetical protein [Xanthocytophaga flavus]MDJ1486420.1 hypothetical protein [Xanthocytophaga flavus]